MNLYAVSKQIEAINGLIDYHDGEITPEVESALEEIKADMVKQADGIAGWIRNLRAEAKAAKEEADLFMKRSRSRANLAERVASLFLVCMQGLAINKLRGMFILTDRTASRPAIRWVGEGLIPKKYRRVRVELDGDAVYQDYKAGKKLPEGFEVKYSHWLDIK